MIVSHKNICGLFLEIQNAAFIATVFPHSKFIIDEENGIYLKIFYFY